MRGKNLSVYGEYGKCRVVCGTQNFLQIRGKNLCVHGEDAKRLLAYSPNTPRDIKVILYISANNNTNKKKIIFFLSTLYGID
jgi:hypothetical protein